MNTNTTDLPVFFRCPSRVPVGTGDMLAVPTRTGTPGHAGMDRGQSVSDNVTLIQPLPSSVGVAVHPHVNGDVVSVSMVDTATGTRHLVVLDPATAYVLGADLTEATTSEAVAAQADAVRGSTGHTDPFTDPS